MAGWHHRLDGREFEWTPGVGDRQGGLHAAIHGVAKSWNDWATELNWLHYSILIDSFISSRSLLTFLTFSQFLSPDYLSVTPFYFQNFRSVLLSLFWILFQVDSLSPPLLFALVGFYHVPLPTEYFSAFSSCLGCCVWGGLSVCWKFVVPFYCGGSSLWVGLDKCLVKVSWLGKLVLGFWWVELDLLSLECNEVSSSEFWGVYGLGVAFGCLYFCAQGYVPAFLEN